jgi:hypothetical protein
MLSSSADGMIWLWEISRNEEYEENPHASMINCISKACYAFKIKNQQFFDTPTSVDWIHNEMNHFISGYVNS